jgi:hypothetical protein
MSLIWPELEDNYNMSVAQIARKEIGYVEDAGNRTKYGEWFGLNGLPWCGIFVSWCFAMAGRPLPNIGFKKGFAGVQFAYEYYRNMKKITMSPKEGDIVLYDFDGNGRYDHTGIFVRWIEPQRRFEAIEGNTSTKNQRNGGSVMLRERKNNSSVKFVNV